MGQAEITVFIILVNLVLVIFISGIIIFIFQYRRKKIIHEKEKALLEEQHKVDLLNARLNVQQQTMQFIGREIHDSVAQKLTLGSIYSQKIEFENKYPDLTEKINRISEIINDSLAELRDLSQSLADNRIQDTSLKDLLKQESENVNNLGFCKAVVAINFNQQISVTVKSFLLRIVQEFIQNSLKHSGCEVIEIALREKEEGLFLSITDDGKGFDSNNTDYKGIGLNNMKRRAQLIGGIYNLQSNPGAGTTLTIFIKKEKLSAE